MIINDRGWVLNLSEMLCRGFRRRASGLPQGLGQSGGDFEGIRVAGKEGFVPRCASGPVNINTGPARALVGLGASSDEACGAGCHDHRR